MPQFPSYPLATSVGASDTTIILQNGVTVRVTLGQIAGLGGGGGGGVTSPGGFAGQIQFNSSGVFGGLSLGAGIAVSSGSLILSGIPLSSIAQSGATSGQYLAWNGATWVPVTGSGGGSSGVTTFNSRSGSVTMTLGDVTGVTGTGSGAVTALGLGTAALKAASGSTGTVASVSGSFVAGHLAIFSDASGTIADGGPVPSGAGSGTVSTGTAGTLAFYASNGTTVSPLTLDASLSISGTTLSVVSTAPTALTAITTPALTDIHVSNQGGVDLKETNTQLATLILNGLTAGSNVTITGSGATRTIAATGGGSTSPAGSDGQIQINNGGAFGVATIGSGLTLTGSGASRVLSASGGSGATLYSRPALSAFAWLNQGSATATEYSGGPIAMTAPYGSGDAVRGLEQTLAGGTFTNTVVIDAIIPAAPFYQTGLYLRNSSTGAITVLELTYNNGTGRFNVSVARFASTTSFTAADINKEWRLGARLYLRAAGDGTNVYYLISADGFAWYQVFQHTFSAAQSPTRAGFFLDCNDNSPVALNASASLRAFELTSTYVPQAQSAVAGV